MAVIGRVSRIKETKEKGKKGERERIGFDFSSSIFFFFFSKISADELERREYLIALFETNGEEINETRFVH